MDNCPLPLELVLNCLKYHATYKSLYLCKVIYDFQVREIYKYKVRLLSNLVYHQQKHGIDGRRRYVQVEDVQIPNTTNLTPTLNTKLTPNLHKSLTTILHNPTPILTQRITSIISKLGNYNFKQIKYTYPIIPESTQQKLINLEQQLDVYSLTSQIFLRKDEKSFYLLNSNSNIVELLPSLKRHLINNLGYLYTISGFVVALLLSLIKYGYITRDLEVTDKIKYTSLFTTLVAELKVGKRVTKNIERTQRRRQRKRERLGLQGVASTKLEECQLLYSNSSNKILRNNLIKLVKPCLNVVEENTVTDEEVITLCFEARLLRAQAVEIGVSNSFVGCMCSELRDKQWLGDMVIE